MEDWQRPAFIGWVEKFIGKPYEYGGGHGGISPNWLPKVFDCSGVIVTSAQLSGLYGWSRDENSRAMWREMEPIDDPQPGDLVFWYREGTQKIFHVEVLAEKIEDSWMCCGARGSRGAVVRTAGFVRPGARFAGFRRWTG